jgi:hypothetical protein
MTARRHQKRAFWRITLRVKWRRRDSNAESMRSALVGMPWFATLGTLYALPTNTVFPPFVFPLPRFVWRGLAETRPSAMFCSKTGVSGNPEAPPPDGVIDSHFFRSWLSRRQCIARRTKNVQRADGPGVGSTTLCTFMARRKQVAIESTPSTSATFDHWLQTGRSGSLLPSRPCRCWKRRSVGEPTRWLHSTCETLGPRPSGSGSK